MIDQVTAGVEAGVLVNAIVTTGKWLATAARTPRGRKAEDLSIARWFETYKLTRDVPELPDLSPDDAERLADVLRGPEIQAALQELLAARLTDAPERDASQAREVFVTSLTRALPAASPLTAPLAGFYDAEICELVARLEANEPKLLAQIRTEAMSARMIAVLNAIERHTAALTNAPRDADTWLANYRRQAIDHHGKLQPPDFDRRRRVPIKAIYVPATIYEEHSSERIIASPQPPPSLTVWDLGSRADRTVLLGDPGGGKTTASNVLVHHFASNETARIPFLVTLRDFASSTPECSVVGWIEHQLETFYQCPPPPGLVDTLLLTGRAIVFFDGLDELLDTSRREDVANRVERFCTEYPLAPVLVTSRVVGYDQARLDDTQFTCYRLGGFRDEDVTNYVRKWFALDTEACSDEADAFMSESESVQDLRSNPLLLSLMCILYRGEGSLPRNRAEIYKECATLLFRKWDARRRIHQDLRAGHLIEPTLRHLAWWLFTREDTKSAVTERELVTAATEFLHGRGFESSDQAREAAQEFIEFCRGRMWVFTDTGTTATGEPLYSFTHRTFLEYFAASQIAFDSDTPEKLARTLAPHIAKGKWQVVGELAIQIKDSTSSEGAKRIYEHLLNDRRHRAPEGRSHILQFLARTIRSVDPSPQVTHRLAREAVNFPFSVSPGTRVSPFQIMRVLDTSLGITHKEVIQSAAGLIRSDDHDKHVNGLLLTLYLSELHPTNELNAAIHDYTQDVINAASYSTSIAALALRRGILAVDQILSMRGGIRLLFGRADIIPFGLSMVAHLPYQFWFVAHGPPDESSVARASAVRELTSFGLYLTEEWRLPLVSGPGEDWDILDWDEEGSAQPLPIDTTTYLGCAVTFCIWSEQSDVSLSAVLRGEPSKLGQFSDLYWYVESRKIGKNFPQKLPDLPVPDEFKQVFRDWAAGKVNFVGDSPGANA